MVGSWRTAGWDPAARHRFPAAFQARRTDDITNNPQTGLIQPSRPEAAWVVGSG
jgi:hypothetical protein